MQYQTLISGKFEKNINLFSAIFAKRVLKVNSSFQTVDYTAPMVYLGKQQKQGQLSVSGKRMCTIVVNRLED